MGRYRKVDTRIWNDARFIRLDADSKLVFLFVLTHPHMTSLGAMRATVPGLAAELDWTTERLQKAFDELTVASRNGASSTVGHALIDYDQDASFIGLPNFLKYNPPENPNVVTSWGSLLDLLPECEAKTRLLERIQSCVESRGEAFVVAWESVSGTVCRTIPEGLPQQSDKPFQKGSEDSKPDSGDGMANPEPEPKPEQEPKTQKKAASGAAGVKQFQPPTVTEVRDYCRERRNNVDPEKFIDYYTSNGWRVGKGPMRNWQAAVRNWERSNGSRTPQSGLMDSLNRFAAGEGQS